MENNKIDINADVGEGFGIESQIMPYIASCNIACGGHAGDLETMKYVASLAKNEGVKIGAHPSFPDKKNFGRKIMKLSNDDLFFSLKHQIQQLIKVLENQGILLNHIKPHGALYNLAAVDKEIAKTIIRVIKSLEAPVKLYVPYLSIISELALQEHIPIVYEAFADRNYNADLTLLSRSHKNAMIQDENLIYKHVSDMFFLQKVKTITQHYKPIKADTYCVHGDHPNALPVIKSLMQKFDSIGVRLNKV